MLPGLIFIVLSVPFYFGKGSSLIAGYNTSSSKEKAKFNEKILCRIMAVLFDIIGILFIIKNYGWINESEMMIFAVAAAIVSVMLANTAAKK